MIKVEAASGAQVTCVLRYPGTKPQVLKQAIGAKGIGTLVFKTGYTPSRLDGLAQVTVMASGVVAGIVRGSASAKFTVQRRDAILLLTRLKATVRTPRVPSHGTAIIDLVAARGAYVQITLAYAGTRAKGSYAIVVDGSGYGTVRLPVNYKLAKGKSSKVVATMVASQGIRAARATATFLVQG
jgi:hypothetical protein